MVLDDKASSFLLQVRQAMAASSGSPVSAESIPLEEVAAAVEASGGGFSSVLNEVAAATLSNSVSILFFIIVSWSAFSSWCQFLSWILNFLYYLIVWAWLDIFRLWEIVFALVCLIGFSVELNFYSSFLEFLFPLIVSPSYFAEIRWIWLGHTLRFCICGKLFLICRSR